MDNRMLKRIERVSGIRDLGDVLDQLAPTDLQSLLLEVYSRRANRMSAKAIVDVLAQDEP